MSGGYADAGLVWDLLSRFADPAGERFEAVLAASGLDADTARALRFWHAESVQAVKQYAAEAVPAVLAALDRAAADVAESAARAERVWAEAGRPVPETGSAVVALPLPGGAEEERRRTVALRIAQLG